MFFGFLWCSYEFPRFFYGFLMIFLWFAIVFPSFWYAFLVFLLRNFLFTQTMWQKCRRTKVVQPAILLDLLCAFELWCTSPSLLDEDAITKARWHILKCVRLLGRNWMFSSGWFVPFDSAKPQLQPGHTSRSPATQLVAVDEVG